LEEVVESARIDCAVRGRDFKRDLEAIAKRGILAAGVELW